MTKVLIAVAIVGAAAGSAAADNTCAKTKATTLAPLALTADLPDGTVKDYSGKDHQAIGFKSADKVLDLNVATAQGQDLSFDDTKKEFEDTAKKHKTKLTWKVAEKTADGYHLVLQQDDTDGKHWYLVVYLRKIKGAPYLCVNMSNDKSSFDCAPRACESLSSR